MTLEAGSKLGPYEIVASIGVGGMGEVYRARDPRVGREVAIKVSAERFSERFEREARAVAALNHPNICTLYDVGPDYIVMELVEGETLEDRIKQCAIPLEEALTIARQIADALEAAHEKGIIHRDLKPGNIKIRPDGMVKVLDFGLAKVAETQSVSLSNSPTISLAATQEGVILGTAGYMSPEQARGKPVDKRVDIWAFGVILYEMLTGKRLFEGDTVSDTLAGVLTKEPDWEKVPVKVRPLLRRSLQKDPKQRLRDMGDAMLLLEPVPEPISGKPARPWLVWSIAIICFVGALILAVPHFLQAPADAPEMCLEINTPATSDPSSFAISPDGRHLIFVASGEGGQRLWLRPLNQVMAQPLEGTEDATNPFWSPDSRSIGFCAELKLKRIDIAGGPAQVLANAPDCRGGTWNRDGVIVFAPSRMEGLYRVPAAGGERVGITHPDPQRHLGHTNPQFLPDGHHLLFFAEGAEQGIYFAALDSGEFRRLIAADLAVYAPPGYLLFVRQGVLFAQDFDAARGEVRGDPVPVSGSSASRSSLSIAGLSASETRVLAYRTQSHLRQLIWFDRSGKEVGTLGAPDENDLDQPALSPDGLRVAVSRQVQGNQNIWLIDAKRGVSSRLTFNAAAICPIWSPDGSRIVFDSYRNGPNSLYLKASSGAGSEELLPSPFGVKVPFDWSRDGRFILYLHVDPKTAADLWALPLFGERKPIPIAHTQFEEALGQFSPDGRWVAYISNESGSYEVYVQAFPDPGGKWQISTSGGKEPRWRPDGKELFYIAPDGKLMATPIQVAGQVVKAGAPAALFQTRIVGGGSFFRGYFQYMVAPDGKNFLINTTAEGSAASPITIVTNWPAGLKK
jgi:serine/threonine protein kinase